MKYARISTIALLVTSVAGSVTLAQTAVTTPINNWSYQRHSSTATEGFLRGTATVIQATGQKNYLDSIANVNHQEAQRRRIENSNLYVKTYFENKEINRQYRAKYASAPPTKERWARITAAALPDRLTESQYDPTTGKLVWPHILRDEEYTAFRNRIDELFASRSPDSSGDGSPSQREIANLIDGMKMLLKTNIETVSLSQYGNAKMFLLSLDYEAQLPLDNAPRT